MPIHLWPDGADAPICGADDGRGAPRYRRHLVTCHDCCELLRVALVLARTREQREGGRKPA